METNKHSYFVAIPQYDAIGNNNVYCVTFEDVKNFLRGKQVSVLTTKAGLAFVDAESDELQFIVFIVQNLHIDIFNNALQELQNILNNIYEEGSKEMQKNTQQNTEFAGRYCPTFHFKQCDGYDNLCTRNDFLLNYCAKE